MSHFIRDVGLLIALILALAFLVSLFVYKRTDVSWFRFLIAGPMTVLSPSRYLRPERAMIPPLLFVLTMLLFAVVWFASWFIENP